jgi:hypothetical protein
MNDLSTQEAIDLGLFENPEKHGFEKQPTKKKKKQEVMWVVLRTGVIFRFYADKQPFSFNEDGWFVGSGYVKMPGEKASSNLVENFTFHSNELSCYWQA